MNQGNGHEVPLAKRSQLPTTILNLLEPGKLMYADYWTKHHPESHHCNMCKEFLTSFIMLELLPIEQQHQHTTAACAA
jgi:hypothetical protein